MFEKIVGYIRKRFWSHYDQCYEFMESTGYATQGCCGGRYDPDPSMGNLAADCVDCPFWVYPSSSSTEGKE